MSITVVTINYNDAPNLRATIESVLEQDSRDLEYIIVDGGSTDESPAIIREYEKNFTAWVSEKDGGIYDAMNKGVALSRGEWINFMNSGDRFADANSVSRAFQGDVSNLDIIYGDYILRYPDLGDAPRRAAPPGEFWKGLNICHQTFFTRRRLLEERPFDVKLRIAADFQFANHCVSRGARFARRDFPISIVAAGGLSDVSRVDSLRECLKVLEELAREEGRPLDKQIRRYYRRRMAREYLRGLLPRKLIDLALRLKRG